MSETAQRIAKITLDEGSVVRRSAEVEHERAVALYDLIEENSFQPLGESFDAYPGPYHLHLAIEESRLVFDIRDAGDQGLGQVQLSLLPFRRIVKDYFHVCESYFDAIKTASPSKIEAIDMGRRGLHDEGSTLLMERLADKIAIDHPTARRLFTLICVLHIKG